MTRNRDVTVRVPATTANLGPGFDCLGMALDVWNETQFRVCGEGTHVQIAGYGCGMVPTDERNLVVQALRWLYARYEATLPHGLEIICRNNIPMGSGMGSSAAAVLSGLMAANVLLGSPASREELLAFATEIEGHPDNVAAAVYGGLTVTINTPSGLLTRRFTPADWNAAIVVPQIDLPTRTSRAALPQQVAMKDAIYNIGRSVLVVEALRSGDSELLARSMHDVLHQPYRLKLIPGAEKALQSALHTGAAAAVISGAGPGLIAFTKGPTGAILQAMMSALEESGARAIPLEVKTTCAAAVVG